MKNRPADYRYVYFDYEQAYILDLAGYLKGNNVMILPNEFCVVRADQNITKCTQEAITRCPKNQIPIIMKITDRDTNTRKAQIPAGYKEVFRVYRYLRESYKPEEIKISTVSYHKQEKATRGRFVIKVHDKTQMQLLRSQTECRIWVLLEAEDNILKTTAKLHNDTNYKIIGYTE